MSNKYVRSFSAAAIATVTLGASGLASANIVVPVEEDFFTTAWAFGAPFVRDAGRPTIGVSTPDPFLQSGGGTVGTWEETTYFTFDFDPSQFTGPVSNAVLEVETATRAFGTVPSVTDPFAISAHRVTSDPTTIDPSLDSSSSDPLSYVNFNSTEFGAVEDTVSITGTGIEQWDITDLVNEWIANGDVNFDYSIAMTGRVGNPADTDSSGFFHAFVNSGEGPGQSAQLIIVPSPSGAITLAVIPLLGLRRRSASSR
ncbi:MAG: hypothetical protein AAGA25_13555 [Planctomycetota bacterium]